MIQENKKVKVHLFWGGRTQKSLALYDTYIAAALKNKTLTSFQVAYSQEKKICSRSIRESNSTYCQCSEKKGRCAYLWLS
jgi:sulfite reductase alpha subunit-like flavoprotein